jgi:hypothetical protein
MSAVSQAGLLVSDMIKKEGYNSWWSDIKAFKEKVVMCKPYLKDIQAAYGKYSKFMNFFKGEYVCKNRNASNWINSPVD